MKSYRRFAVILLVIDIVILGLMFSNNIANKNIPQRTNTECLLEERVFDYAEKLTNKEEDKLRTSIAEYEKKIGADIIIITINDENINTSNELMNYADDFYDENKFGWNKPMGDGIIYLDNWATNQVWVSTSGKMQDIYSSSMIDKLIDKVCEDVNNNVYESYKLYPKIVADDVLGKGFSIFSFIIAIIASIIISLIFVVVNCFNSKGENTTTKSTYVKKNDFKIVDKKDKFLEKSILKTEVRSSDNGGSHISSSGNSHGGGGGSH